jgi:hypothetical protein
MRQLLPGDQIYEDFLHPSLFWGTISLTQLFDLL